MSSNRNRSHLSQIDQANEILLGLKTNVTTQDKEEAQKELNLGEATVTRYLMGEAKKVDTALELISFLRKRIAERDKVLKGAA